MGLNPVITARCDSLGCASYCQIDSGTSDIKHYLQVRGWAVAGDENNPLIHCPGCVGMGLNQRFSSKDVLLQRREGAAEEPSS